MSLIYYNINFKNQQLENVAVTITDYENYDPYDVNPNTYIDLVGIAPAFELETFNLSEDKFSTILGQRATIRFRSTNAVNFSTFSTGEDYRFFVRAIVASQTIFSGWLIMDENQQDYLPSGQPVILYATDNLAALKDIELSDFNGTRPQGKYRLIEILAWCLNKTEQTLDFIDGIKVACNLFENNMVNVNNCPLNQTYVDIKTFEKSVDEFEDCYTVLNKILFSLGARLCYYNNFWYILRIDEYKGSAFYLASYSPGGVYQSRILGQSLAKNLDANVDFVSGTIQRIQRPYKSVKVKKNYEFPEELLSNLTFKRGTLLGSVTGPPRYDKYTPSDWSYVKIAGDGSEASHSFEYYIKVITDSVYFYETDRFMHLPATPGAGDDMRLKSTIPIYVCVGDKFKFGVNFRYSTDLGGGSGHFSVDQAQIRLYGDNGTYWTLSGSSGSNITDESIYWKQTTSAFVTDAKYLSYEGNLESIDFTEWQSIDIESAPIPVTGYIIVYLMNDERNTNPDKDFQNLSFEYIPMINGRRSNTIVRPSRPLTLITQKPTGERFSMSTSDAYNKKFEEDFYLFDAPCKSFKGAMFYKVSSVYYLTANWFDQAMGVYDIPGLLNFSYRFLHWQTYYIWNQLRKETRILQASLHGFDTANNYAGLIHKYTILNSLYPLSVEHFIILSMRQDWHNCTWTATLAQVNNTDQPRQGGSSGENFEFKYLE